MPDTMTVHCMHYGHALCGRPGLPKDWPSDESWLSKADWPLTDKEIDKHRDLDGEPKLSMCTACRMRFDEEQAG